MDSMHDPEHQRLGPSPDHLCTDRCSRHVIDLADTSRRSCLPSQLMPRCFTGMQAVKSVKGILNKLTPEAFDKLLEQLKSTITSTEILHGSIALVFESAVAQPTFVGMYAELCVRLSKVRAAAGSCVSVGMYTMCTVSRLLAQADMHEHDQGHLRQNVRHSAGCEPERQHHAPDLAEPLLLLSSPSNLLLRYPLRSQVVTNLVDIAGASRV